MMNKIIFKTPNYRKEYQMALVIDLSNDFEIHHIDGDRSNNILSNLVALPKKLHQDFHLSLSNLWKIDTDNKDLLKPLSTLDNGSRYLSEAILRLNEYNKFLNEVQYWMDYRNHLLGLFPNIHNLSYES